MSGDKDKDQARTGNAIQAEWTQCVKTQLCRKAWRASRFSRASPRHWPESQVARLEEWQAGLHATPRQTTSSLGGWWATGEIWCRKWYKLLSLEASFYSNEEESKEACCVWRSLCYSNSESQVHMDGEAPPVRRSLKSKPSESSAKQALNCTVRGGEGNEQGTSWVFEGVCKWRAIWSLRYGDHRGIPCGLLLLGSHMRPRTQECQVPCGASYDTWYLYLILLLENTASFSSMCSRIIFSSELIKRSTFQDFFTLHLQSLPNIPIQSKLDFLEYIVFAIFGLATNLW